MTFKALEKSIRVLEKSWKSPGNLFLKKGTNPVSVVILPIFSTNAVLNEVCPVVYMYVLYSTIPAGVLLFFIELLGTLIEQKNMTAVYLMTSQSSPSHILVFYRKRSRAYTEVHVLQESPLKELEAGKLP